MFSTRIIFPLYIVWEDLSRSETYILVSVAVGLILLAGNAPNSIDVHSTILSCLISSIWCSSKHWKRERTPLCIFGGCLQAITPFVGLMSGLTLGLMGIDKVDLEVIFTIVIYCFSIWWKLLPAGTTAVPQALPYLTLLSAWPAGPHQERIPKRNELCKTDCAGMLPCPQALQPPPKASLPSYTASQPHFCRVFVIPRQVFQSSGFQRHYFGAL